MKFWRVWRQWNRQPIMRLKALRSALEWWSPISARTRVPARSAEPGTLVMMSASAVLVERLGGGVGEVVGGLAGGVELEQRGLGDQTVLKGHSHSLIAAMWMVAW
jgi:hypothetical protein